MATLPNATWTGKEIVTVVSRFSGLGNDTNSRAVVLDNVNLGLWEISLQTPWSWLETTHTDITVVAETASYDLPTAAGLVFDDVYDVRLTSTNERTLDPIDLRTYDRYRRRFQSTSNIPTHYYIYSSQKGGKINLVPTPSAADVLSIRFLTRQTTISDASASSLAVADRYIPLVIYKGLELTSMWKDPEKTAFWANRYERTLSRALQRDRESPDMNVGMSPQIEHGAERVDFVNPDDLTFYPRG